MGLLCKGRVASSADRQAVAPGVQNVPIGGARHSHFHLVVCNEYTYKSSFSDLGKKVMIFVGNSVCGFINVRANPVRICLYKLSRIVLPI